MRYNNKKRGFTLIELMSVIVIIAILSVVLIPTISGYINRSKKSIVINQCKRLYKVIELREVEDQFIFKNNEKQVKDIFEENASFYNYDLIKKDDFNKILNVKLEDELVDIAMGSLEQIIKEIEIDELGNFKRLKN